MFSAQSLLAGNGASVTCLQESREPITTLNLATYVTRGRKPMKLRCGTHCMAMISVQERVRFKFQVGDCVRISKVKRMFEKSYLPNYTEEMFTIYKRFAHQVPVYKLKDDAGEILEGTFCEPKLQKIIKNDDVYRVEKILRKRKRKGVVEYLVKWKGYADKFSSWVSERDISKL